MADQTASLVETVRTILPEMLKSLVPSTTVYMHRVDDDIASMVMTVASTVLFAPVVYTAWTPEAPAAPVLSQLPSQTFSSISAASCLAPAASSSAYRLYSRQASGVLHGPAIHRPDVTKIVLLDSVIILQEIGLADNPKMAPSLWTGWHVLKSLRRWGCSGILGLRCTGSHDVQALLCTSLQATINTPMSTEEGLCPYNINGESPEYVIHLPETGLLVKNITINLDATFKTAMAALQTPYWSFSIAPVFDVDFAGVAQITDVDFTKLEKLISTSRCQTVWLLWHHAPEADVHPVPYGCSAYWDSLFRQGFNKLTLCDHISVALST